jgi:hypothetical protein
MDINLSRAIKARTGIVPAPGYCYIGHERSARNKGFCEMRRIKLVLAVAAVIVVTLVIVSGSAVA